jgi:DNA-binding NarL/FixJ family response regulator
VSVNPIRILLADPEPLVIEAMKVLISQSVGVELCATAITAGEARDAALAGNPDVLVHELSFPRSSGIDLVRDLAAAGCSTACIAFTRLSADACASHYLNAGGRGFVSKFDRVETLIRGIEVVAGGELFVSESQTCGLLKGLGGLAGQRPQVLTPLQRLTTSEFQVLQLISAGLANREIAETLHRSVKTVETYRARIKKKLNISNGVKLAQFAVLNLDAAYA